MPNVSFRRPELIKRAKQYELIKDAIFGEVAVKAKGVRYLPSPEPLANDPEAQERYAGYLARAVYYNVTGRTLRGLVGQLFNRAPLIEVPAYLEHTVADMNGLGVNAQQQCKATAGDVTALGRAGLFTDFPAIDEGKETVVADLLSGRIKPSITRYEPMQIINWRFSTDGTAKKLLFVVLEEEREIIKEGDFTFTNKKQWRVLRLDDSGLYVHELYYDNNSAPVATYYPVDYNADRLDAIPFEFVGAEDNDPTIDEPPMYDIASVNMGHYHNSADLEDSIFWVGQPTIAMIGLTTAWINDVFKGKPIKFGSRHVIPLPDGASINMVQADPNTMAKDGMESKERQMVALGAKLVEQRQVQRTATEANHEEAGEASVLQTVADNTSVAYAQAFAHASRFLSGDDPKINFKINTAFEISAMDAASRLETIKEWQLGAIAFPEMRAVLRRGGIATLSDAEAKLLIDKEEQERAALIAASQPANVQDPANPDPNPVPGTKPIPAPGA